MKKAFIHLADGFEEIEAITLVDVLRRADIPVFMVSITGKKEVEGAHGISIVSDVLFEDVDYSESAMVILPGGLPGAHNLADHKGLAKVLESQNTEGKPIAAVCAAPLVLGRLGILEGKQATCYPGFENELKGAELKHDLAVKSGNIITSRGPGTTFNFALEIVSTLKGKEVADGLANGMLVQTWN